MPGGAVAGGGALVAAVVLGSPEVVVTDPDDRVGAADGLVPPPHATSAAPASDARSPATGSRRPGRRPSRIGDPSLSSTLMRCSGVGTCALDPGGKGYRRMSEGRRAVAARDGAVDLSRSGHPTFGGGVSACAREIPPTGESDTWKSAACGLGGRPFWVSGVPSGTLGMYRTGGRSVNLRHLGRWSRLTILPLSLAAVSVSAAATAAATAPALTGQAYGISAQGPQPLVPTPDVVLPPSGAVRKWNVATHRRSNVLLQG